MTTRIAYGIFISLGHVAWFSAVGLFFGAPTIQQKILGLRHWIDRVFGVLLVSFGIVLATTDLAA